MLELALPLIDRLIQLVKSRQDTDRNLYVDFLIPLQKDFEILHEDYMKAFQGFRKKLKETTEPLLPGHEIIDIIENDSRATAHLRAKILALHEVQDDPRFGRLVRAAAAYIGAREMLGRVMIKGYRSVPNSARTTAITGLKEIFESNLPENEKKIASVKLIDKIIDELQDNFALFQALFSPAKLALLDKRFGRLPPRNSRPK